MGAVWFWILAGMLTVYAVLDGFDLGAGVVHLFVARTDGERRTVLRAIGPLWDGNEVWLVAGGGVLVFAFPPVYAAAFSGLYLPLIIVLWLLVLRAVSIEVRSQVDHPLWRHAFDVVFASSSLAIAVVLGVALGNVVRGVPLDASGYFHEDLFGMVRGAIDPYTFAMGVFALVALAGHGAVFLAWKTEGAVSRRCAAWARWSYRVLPPLLLIVSTLTLLWVPAFFHRIVTRPWVWPLPVAALFSAGGVLRGLSRARELEAFLASCAFLALLLAGTAATLYPTLLRSTLDDAFSLDTASSTSSATLTLGLALWLPAIVLATAYFVHTFRSFRGKVGQADAHE